jgi:hypothetical protein
VWCERGFCRCAGLWNERGTCGSMIVACGQSVVTRLSFVPCHLSLIPCYLSVIRSPLTCVDSAQPGRAGPMTFAPRCAPNLVQDVRNSQPARGLQFRTFGAHCAHVPKVQRSPFWSVRNCIRVDDLRDVRKTDRSTSAPSCLIYYSCVHIVNHCSIEGWSFESAVRSFGTVCKTIGSRGTPGVRDGRDFARSSTPFAEPQGVPPHRAPGRACVIGRWVAC